MGIKHKFVSARSDGGDTSLVRPSNWNADHDHVPFVVTVATNLLWSNMPAADTELGNTSYRFKIDLASATQMRMVGYVTTAGAAGADLRP